MPSYIRSPDSFFVNSLLQKTGHMNPKMYQSALSARNPQEREQYVRKLPAVQMRRSSSTASQRNAKFKLVSMEDKLEQFHSFVRNTRLDTQQIYKEVKMLKQILVEEELPKHREDLRKQIKGLERLVRTTVVVNQERTQQLKADCEEIWLQTQNIRQKVFELRMKIQDVDCRLGFKQ